MLQSIATLTPEQRIDAMLARPGWVAICQDTGAYLMVSYGRSKLGTGRKYTLILPKTKGNLFDYGKWDNQDRKQFRAGSTEEAIEAANKKLEKMLAKRATN